MQQSRIYLVAAILSLFFYIVGVISGLFIEKSMTDYTEEKVKSLQRRVENLQLEYAYLSIIGEDLSCDSLSLLVSETTKKVRDLGRELETEKGDFEDLRRDYALLSTKAWILNRYMKDKCGNNVVVVLYFYSVPCQECIEQGHILDELREKNFHDKLIVFVLNADLDEPIVNMLKKTHNISSTPALVIEDKTYKGLIERERLKEIISEKL
ncbi:MAG TPA: hypothetical protein ENF58_01830 [Candidatus Altiarchaeales archaeon]|nr:hypothetical protein [Candidatus Altiarchaeales archaeon]